MKGWKSAIFGLFGLGFAAITACAATPAPAPEPAQTPTPAVRMPVYQAPATVTPTPPPAPTPTLVLTPAPAPQAVSPAPVVPTPVQAPRPASPPGGPSLAEYRLDAGDKLKITVFGEPDLSGNFEVDGQGVISMSLIGEVTAKNLTIRELQRLIETKLKDGFVREPQVSAEVQNYRPYYILGEIAKAGEYPYIAGLTVMNAIASAGDFTYRADKRRVFIKSVDSPREREVELTATLQVRPGDTIRVKERFF